MLHDVWRRAPTYDAAGGSVVGWIMNQARSRAIDRLRFEQRKKRVNDHSDPPGPTRESGPQETFDVANRVGSCDMPCRRSRRMSDARSKPPSFPS